MELILFSGPTSGPKRQLDGSYSNHPGGGMVMRLNEIRFEGEHVVDDDLLTITLSAEFSRAWALPSRDTRLEAGTGVVSAMSDPLARRIPRWCWRPDSGPTPYDSPEHFLHLIIAPHSDQSPSRPARCTPMLETEVVRSRRGGFTRRKFIKGG